MTPLLVRHMIGLMGEEWHYAKLIDVIHVHEL